VARFCVALSANRQSFLGFAADTGRAAAVGEVTPTTSDDISGAASERGTDTFVDVRTEAVGIKAVAPLRQLSSSRQVSLVRRQTRLFPLEGFLHLLHICGYIYIVKKTFHFERYSVMND
jgi:hypothetical protein